MMNEDEDDYECNPGWLRKVNDYWLRMKERGYWKEGKGWTDKGRREILKEE
jgi:hypothetical protein